MKKVLILLACTALVLPFLLLGAAAFALPAQYTETFVGALSDKYERLTSIEEPKIVIIGGSSTAFGLNSAMIEEYMGMPVVNFGLYATLGTKLMMDLSRANIGEGDIVLLAPEVDPQTLSLYFSGEATLQAADGNFALLRHLPAENLTLVAGSLWRFAGDKFAFWQAGNAPDPEGIYNRDSFNEYGDISYSRPYNIMAAGYDPNTVIALDPASADEEFIAYVNEYTAWCRARGAEVYFSFSPINEKALAEGTTDADADAFFASMVERLDCEVISDISHCIMEWEYFYDTNFHLNEAGVTHHTAALIGDLRRAAANPEPYRIELPDKPQRADIYVDASQNDTTGFFLYEVIDGIMTLTGTTELGKQQKTLVMPLANDGMAVQAAAAGAFDGCAVLEEIVVEADTHLALLHNGVFSGAPALKRITLQTGPDDVLVGDNLMEGAAPDARIFVKSDRYGDFAAHYFWGEYMNVLALAG